MQNTIEPAKDMSEIRHSAAHLLAAAVLSLWPNAKHAIGPAIENGFYYDFDLGVKLSPDDLRTIETKMRHIIQGWGEFSFREVSADEARAAYKDNPYKLELIDEIVKKNEAITFYRWGEFEDLCRGGHVKTAKEITIEGIALQKIAGAYWRGDHQRPMLTRIYGLAFSTKKELDEHLGRMEEAAKRDHRKLGRELDLFLFSELVGSGLPLWTPKGTLVRNLLDEFVWELRKSKGYQRVTIPHITKKDLYETSGHWEKYAADLFRVTSREHHEFALKPMNCPHHAQIYARKQLSYRELPQRYTETTMVYRDEQSGELGGLSRVRCITQDDAHIFCRESQLSSEINSIWDIVENFYTTCGFENLAVRLSLHDPQKLDQYLGTRDVWEKTEEDLREIVSKRGVIAQEAIGEAAVYGPKIDFLAKDSLARTWQVATIQIDRNQPERFDLSCINESGEAERIVMIHAAIMGSLERFLSIYIEHTAGLFPLWLSPVQVRVIPVSAPFIELATSLATLLADKGIRTDIDSTDDTVAYKVRQAFSQKIPYSVVVGKKEEKLDVLSIRVRGIDTPRVENTAEWIQRIQDLVRVRSNTLE